MESNIKHGRVNFKMAGDGWQLVKGVKLIVEFAKISIGSMELFGIVFSVFESGKLCKTI